MLPKRFINGFLLLCSLFFYAWGEPVYVFLMLFSITFNYVIARMIEQCGSNKKKLFLILAVLVNLGALGLFKYFNFAVRTLNDIVGYTVMRERYIPLPIGISFYTFQALSYVVDVYKRKVKAQKNFIHLALYISFFPQLIAGPIIQYKDVNEQLEHREMTSEKTAVGFYRFFIGLGKKVLISNVMAGVADTIFGLDYLTMHSFTAWIGIISYTLQIYYDFSGYSDMAIGLGKIFGFDFVENFRLPYTADSIKNFWTKWHISLSSWFKEYLYIPLGGNRKGAWNTYRNNLIVFLATGIWHGASWNFVIWGLIHGAFLILERMGLGKVLERLPKIFRRIYTMLVVMVAWVFFRVENLSSALDFVKTMFVMRTSTIGGYALTSKEVLIMGIAIFFAGFHEPVLQAIQRKTKETSNEVTGAKCVFSLGIYILAVCSLVAGVYNPFIYFRF